MTEKRVSEEELNKIKQLIESIRFGSVTVVVQDGKVIQIEKNEKIRLNNK
ncbi:MAG TPA: YezD family protein [Candidatus Pelethocola excrementipullorum]|nr:YezD family protein [Candidatus Pelethocola excrementipullorum]